MDPLHEPTHHTGKPPKRPLVVGGIAGGLIDYAPKPGGKGGLDPGCAGSRL